MRYRLIVLLFAVFFCLPSWANPKYFGYFANNTVPPDISFQPDNYAHTNITYVYSGSDPYNWDATILREVGLAKGYGNKAIVSVTSYVFDTTISNAYRIDPFAAAQFNALVDKLIAAGYLVPGNPEASTVAAFYPVDEPERYGLSDYMGFPSPALSMAVEVIRANPATHNFPIAAVVSGAYGPVVQGMGLFDWVGLDHYPGNDGDYRNALTTFYTHVRQDQKIIIVPQAAYGTDLDGEWHNPEYMHFLAQAESRVILLMPFLWAGQPGVTGVRDIASLRSSYTAIGHQVKYGLYPMHVGSSVPGTMTAGQYYAVSLTFNNASDKTWRAGTNINLGSQGPVDNYTWGLNRVALPHDVGPYQNVAFNFTVRAPTTPGSYTFQWQMVADGVAWLGSPTPAQGISVVAPASGSISANPNPCTIPYGGSNCTTRITWNSNRYDAQVWASAPDGSGATLFAYEPGGAGSSYATWITTGTVRFTLKSGGVPITYVDVSGVQSSAPPDPPPHCSTPKCVEP
ncbi:hypothetical protein MNR01_06005 [Lysobacter sp. S4-A87]|uniref:hypothetical protein n=1 Tax=Lysobacter sp. S4-A87 TaxID=2925843 RepID=UPI001F53B5C5|nr:hypothetical protein [Lysobacter sp. S4-A87]UNK50558.1 hypothetical protein MNR01_06005 [Lysobacter sp. S4-A87]